ncbi:MAG TPA: hypothetical protein VLI06_13755 [Solimonas sp.]|nr:hypothetical protein [Solimonas sp.]
MPIRLILCCVAILVVLPVSAAPPGWDCRSTDASGQCIGLSTYTEADGSRLSGLRSSITGHPAWSGLLIRYLPNGERRECQADGEGRCQGQVTIHRANGQRETGAMVVRNNAAVWTGEQTTVFSSGEQLKCAVTPEGICSGNASLTTPTGTRTSGRLVPKDGGSAWSGRIVTSFANGDRRECSAAADGLCSGPTTYTYADGTQLIGTRMVRGDRSVWSGVVTQVFPSGRRMQCDASGREGLCSEDTQIPVDDRGIPLARIPR